MRVLAFGTFDPLHEGHRNFFRRAKALGSHLTVVVARDSWLSKHKGRESFVPEGERRRAVAEQPEVDETLLGDEWPCADPYRLLGVLQFDALVLGYDQAPDDTTVRAELAARGRGSVQVVRLKPYCAGRYKSSLLRGEV